MPNSVIQFSGGRSLGGGLRRPTLASRLRQFALRHQMALALIFVICGSVACIYPVEVKEQYTDPVTLITRSRVTHTSFMSNIGNSFGGLIFGIIIIPIAIAVLVWNEFRAVRKWKSLVEVEHKCRKISPDSIQPALDGKLVHFNGALAAKSDDFKSLCRDAEFNVSFPNALHVNRTVEMMQWKAHKSTRTEDEWGGGTKTIETFRYEKEWSSSHIEFEGNDEDRAEFRNPPMRFHSTTVQVPALLGAFTICPEHLARLSHNATPLSSLDRAAVVAAFQAVLSGISEHKTDGTELILAQHPELYDREIGDYRITYASVEQGQEMSILGMQNSKTISNFIPVYDPEGSGILLVEDGLVSPHEMVNREQGRGEAMVWMFRLVGFLFCWAGFSLLLHPVCIFLKFIPALFHLCGALSGVASFVLGLALFLISVAAAWFLSRPLLVLSLVGTGVALWTTFGTPEMHEAWVLPAWIGVMVLVHGGIAGWNFYIKDDPERTPLLA